MEVTGDGDGDVSDLPKTWIAEQRVVIVHPNGRRVSGHIAVGRPCTVDPASSDESHCAVEIDGLWSGAHPIIGSGTLQALLLGVQFLGTVLHGFIARGGRVLDREDGTDVPLSALFGPMLREIEASRPPRRRRRQSRRPRRRQRRSPRDTIAA